MAVDDRMDTPADEAARRRLWTAVAVSLVVGGIVGAGVRHVLDDDQANLGTRIGSAPGGGTEAPASPDGTPGGRGATAGVDTDR